MDVKYFAGILGVCGMTSLYLYISYVHKVLNITENGQEKQPCLGII